jgi:hypothetical protein
VDESIADVKEAIGEVRKREVERDEELKSIKEEVEIVRDLLPKVRPPFPLPTFPWRLSCACG